MTMRGKLKVHTYTKPQMMKTKTKMKKLTPKMSYT